MTSSRKLLPLVLLLAAAFGFARADPSSEATALAGRRLLPEGAERVSVGDFPAGESRTARFKLRNQGDAPIAILRVSRACGCADATLSNTNIGVGEGVEIALRTIPNTLVGPFSKSFYVVTSATSSNDRVIQLTVSGRGLPAPAPPAATSSPPPSAVSSSTNAPPAPPPAMLIHAGEAPDGATTNAAAPPQSPLLDVEFFVQAGCAECRLLHRDFLPALAARFGGRIRSRVTDTHERANFLRLLDLLESRRVTDNEPLYMVIDGGEVLSGWTAIKRDGLALLDDRLSGNPRTPAIPAAIPAAIPSATSPPSTPPLPPDVPAPRRLFQRFGWPAVALAGLADGLNPCAFTTIVFLVSLLAASGKRGRALFVGGLAFCLAAFIAYFLIGFGLLACLRRLEAFSGVRLALEWAAIVLLLLLALLSLLDARRYGRTGDAGSVRLQLPGGIKRLVHRVARAQLRGPTLFGASFVCGAAVTLLESVCTGQMYLPTLVFMSREGGGGRAWSLLTLYNLMFVLPLLAVFGLSALGVRSQRLSAWTRRHVVPAKLLLALVFLALAALLVMSMRG